MPCLMENSTSRCLLSRVSSFNNRRLWFLAQLVEWSLPKLDISSLNPIFLSALILCFFNPFLFNGKYLQSLGIEPRVALMDSAFEACLRPNAKTNFRTHESITREGLKQALIDFFEEISEQPFQVPEGATLSEVFQ